MAVNQVQLRRDTNANLVAATPAAGEPAYDTTNKRLTIGDGSKSGGYPIPVSTDIQGQTFTFGTTTGSANSQTLTLNAQLQPAAYASGQLFSFIAGYTNTGATTLTVTALSAKTIKKVVGGALADLIAGDITAGRPYAVMYDGTYFVIMNGSGFSTAPTAGDYMIASAFADASNNPPNTSYIKVAEIIANRTGTYRIRVRVAKNTGTTGTIYVQSRVNGGVVGTELSSTSGLLSYQNDDVAITSGDLVQLYAKGSASSTEWAESLTLFGIQAAAIALCEATPDDVGVNYTLFEDWI